MVWTSGTVGGRGECISGCGGGRWGTRTLWRLRVNGRMILNTVESSGMGKCGIDLYRSWWGQGDGCCEQGNELSVCINWGEFLD